jgi:hypothetical protein
MIILIFGYSIDRSDKFSNRFPVFSNEIWLTFLLTHLKTFQTAAIRVVEKALAGKVLAIDIGIYGVAGVSSTEAKVWDGKLENSDKLELPSDDSFGMVTDVRFCPSSSLLAVAGDTIKIFDVKDRGNMNDVGNMTSFTEFKSGIYNNFIGCRFDKDELECYGAKANGVIQTFK